MPSSAALREPLVEGAIIAGRYTLLRMLGEGGMGSVWVARHHALGVDVAIKFVSAELAARDDIRGRFEREAKAAAKIQSPHVVKMIDHGVDQGDRLFIAMELLEGEDLSTRLEREPRLPLGDVAFVLRDAAKGLGKAHSVGIVHRDVKPDNLFLCRDDDGFVVKVLDFGVARELVPAHEAAFRTGTGALVGTPAFMSPEQALGGRTIDARSDLFSLAVVAYRAVTGRVPFARDGLGETIMAIAADAAPPPSTLRPDVGPALDAWFSRALAKAPEQRHATARELAEEFAGACRADGFAGSLPELRVPSAEVSGPVLPPAHAEAVTVASEPGDPSTASRASAARAHQRAAPPTGTLAGASSHRQPRAAQRAAPWIIAGAAVCAAVALWFLRPPSSPQPPSPAAPEGPAVSVPAPSEPPASPSTTEAAAPASASSTIQPPAPTTAPVAPSAPARARPVARPVSTSATTTKPDWGI